MNLEKNLKELESIACALEQNDLSLEEGIKLYERGIELTKECMTALNEGKAKIAVIREQMSELMKEIGQGE